LANAWKEGEWKTTKDDILKAINGIKNEEKNLPDTLTASGEAKATEAKRTELAGKGFTALLEKNDQGNYTTAVGTDGKMDDNEIKDIEALLKEDAESATLASNRERLTKAKAANVNIGGEIYENAAAYYKANYKGNAKGMDSYSDYLEKLNASVEKFGDEKRQAIIDAYEVPSNYMSVEGVTAGDGYEEWNFNEGLLPATSGTGHLMRKVVMVPEGNSLTLDGEAFNASDYDGKFFYVSGGSLYGAKHGKWWRS
jgi:hypothetical protein